MSNEASCTSLTSLETSDRRSLTILFTVSVAVIVLNLYASQPLIGLIGPSLGLGASAMSLVTTLTLFGYAAGLVFLVPLIDLLPNRQVILVTLVCSVVSLIAMITIPSSTVFLLASVGLGFSSTAIQMLVPVAVAQTTDIDRGHVIGTVQSGIIVGVLVSRPLASVMADQFGWKAFYVLTAVLTAGLVAVLACAMPQRHPPRTVTYGGLIASLGRLLAEESVLRIRSWYQFLLMAAFSTFWTAIALRLAASPFNLGQAGIALFALAGVSGALIAPVAGRIADRGWSAAATTIAHLCAALGFVLAGLAADGSWALWRADEWPVHSLTLMIGAAIVLDLGVVADQTLGRIAINRLRPEARGRINGLYTGLFFLGGSAGAGLAGVAWTAARWAGVCAVGLTFAILALVSRCLMRTDG